MEKLKEFFNKSFGVIQNLLFHEYQSADPCIFSLAKCTGSEKWDISARINCGEACRKTSPFNTIHFSRFDHPSKEGGFILVAVIPF